MSGFCQNMINLESLHKLLSRRSVTPEDGTNSAPILSPDQTPFSPPKVQFIIRLEEGKRITEWRHNGRVVSHSTRPIGEPSRLRPITETTLSIITLPPCLQPGDFAGMSRGMRFLKAIRPC